MRHRHLFFRLCLWSVLALLRPLHGQGTDDRPKQVIIFSGTWCPACRYMEDYILTNAEVRLILHTKVTLQRYEVSRDFVPEPRGAVAFQKYGVNYLPTLVLANADGSFITKLPYAPAQRLVHNLLEYVNGGKPLGPLQTVESPHRTLDAPPSLALVYSPVENLADYIRIRLAETLHQRGIGGINNRVELMDVETREKISFLEPLGQEIQQCPYVESEFDQRRRRYRMQATSLEGIGWFEVRSNPSVGSTDRFRTPTEIPIELYRAAGIPDLEYQVAWKGLCYFPTQYRLWRYLMLKEIAAQGLPSVAFRHQVDYFYGMKPFDHGKDPRITDEALKELRIAIGKRLETLSIEEIREILPAALSVDCSRDWAGSSRIREAFRFWEWLQNSRFLCWFPSGPALGAMIVTFFIRFVLASRRKREDQMLPIPDESQHWLKMYGHLHPYTVDGYKIICQGVDLYWSDARLLDDGSGYLLSNGMQVSFVRVDA